MLGAFAESLRWSTDADPAGPRSRDVALHTDYKDYGVSRRLMVTYFHINTLSWRELHYNPLLSVSCHVSRHLHSSIGTIRINTIR